MGSLAKRKVDSKKVLTVLVLTFVVSALAMFMAIQPAFAVNGINSLFGEAKNLANAVATGLKNLILIVAVAAFVYTAIRMFLTSDPRETQTYKKRLIAIGLIALVAFMADKIITWVQTLANGINL